MRLFACLLVTFFSLSSTAETLTATSNPELVSPQMITAFEDKVFDNQYVSVVATFTGGVWLNQEIVISLGSQESETGQDSFVYPIVGDILYITITQDSDSKEITVFVVTNLGAFDEETGGFKEGRTFYKVVVATDSSNEVTGYSIMADFEFGELPTAK